MQNRFKAAAFLKISLGAVLAVIATLFSPNYMIDAASAEIYVIHNKDGSVTFTSRQPRQGEKSEVFAPKKVGFSVYSVRPLIKSKLFKSEFRELINLAAMHTNVDPHLIRAVIHAESGFNPRAKSPKGAMGLMQLMPGTASLMGVKNPWDPKENILGGARYLSQLLQRFGGNLRFALAGYNSGPENVETFGGIPPFSETQEYVKRVISLQQSYRFARS